MVLKRPFREEGSDNSMIPNHPQGPSTKFRQVVNYVLKEVSLEEIAVKISAILEPTLRRVVKEELDLRSLFHRSSPRHSLVQPESSGSRGYQLLFTKSLPSTLFTNNRIKDEEHASLQVVIVDAKSKNVIQFGPLSSIKVEILVISADFGANGQEDWSESEFNNSIVRERVGKRPLLVGDLSFSLVNGVGFIDNVTFTDNSSWLRSRKFRLGVRAVSNGTGIREAVSEPSVVLDHRGQSYQKPKTPSLDDPVWRLKGIAKDRVFHKNLESYGIETVKDFLRQYNINPSFLRSILGKVPNKTWQTMVKHASECHLDNTFYYHYVVEAERVELLINCVYEVLAVKFEGLDYQRVDTLDIHQKALVDELKPSILLNQNELVPIPCSLATPPLVPSTFQQNIPFSSPEMDLQLDGLSVIDQDEPEKQLDFNLSDSASYPCTIEDPYVAEEDSKSQNYPFPIHHDSPCDGGYYWYQHSPMATFAAPNTQFDELPHPQITSLLYPLATTFGQEYGFLTTPTTAAHIGTQKSKAGYRWCKIRAAVMWQIVRRIAAARRKAKFPLYYWENL